MATVKLKHESGGRQIEVDADTAEVYETQGWQRVSSKKEPASEDAAHEGDE